MSEKKKKTIFFMMCAAAAVLVILLAVFLFGWKGIRSADLARYPVAESYYSVVLRDGDILSQRFTADDTGMRGVTVYPILDAADGDLRVELTDVTDGGRQILSSVSVAVSELENAEWRFIPFRADLAGGHVYEISYSPDSMDGGECWMVIVSEEEQRAFSPWFPCEHAMLNGEETDGCIYQVLNILHPTGRVFNLTLFAVLCGVLIALCIGAGRLLGIIGPKEPVRDLADRVMFFVFDRHAAPVCLVIAALTALIIRIPLLGMESGDYTGYYLPWVEHYRALGAADGLASLPGDYYVPLNLMLLPAAFLPIEPYWVMGFFTTIGDFLLAWFGAKIVRLLLAEKGVAERTAALTAGFAGAMLLLLPPVFLVSAAWKQPDTIYLGLLAPSLYYALKEKWLPSWVFYGLAFVIKLQSIFLLPFFIILYFCRKYPLRYFLIPPVFYLLAGLPAVLCGGEPRFIYGRYLLQTGRYQVMTVAFPNVYNLGLYNGYDVLKTPAVLFTLFCFLILFLICVKCRENLKSKDMLMRLAVLSIWICVMFLPTMHQRYGLGAVVFLFVVFMANRREGWLAAAAAVIVLVETMGEADFLFAENSGVPMLVQTFLYIAAFLVYGYHFLRKLTDRPD